MAVRWFVLQPDGPVERATDAETLDALSLRLPAGAYTTFRTYRRDHALHLAGHIDRLSESAAIEGYTLPLEHRRVRAGLAAAIAECGFQESRIRLTLAYDPPGALHISLEPFAEPARAAYETGVRCTIARGELRRQAPKAKSTSFIASASRARSAAAVHEVLLIGEEEAILEGSSSNFYAVLDGTLRTADAGVLAGITRGMVLRLAADLLPVRLEPIAVRDLARVDEAFITSVSRGVLPVTAIDDRVIGSGVPGPITRDLGSRYAAAIDRELEPIAPTEMPYR